VNPAQYGAYIAEVSDRVNALSSQQKDLLLGYLAGRAPETVEHGLNVLVFVPCCPQCGGRLEADGSHISARSGARIPAAPAVMTPAARCRHCERDIEQVANGTWVDGDGFAACVKAPADSVGGGQAASFVLHMPKQTAGVPS
jgi:hypothetical protein